MTNELAQDEIDLLMRIELADEEIELLLWLMQVRYRDYGHCYGKSLTRLFELGLAQNVSFVSLTEAGRERAKKEAAGQEEPAA